MDCGLCQGELSAYLDSELESGSVRELESHLSSCESCSKELQNLREAAQFMEFHLQDLELRPESWHDVRARITVLPVPVRPGGIRQLWSDRRWLTAAALAASMAMTIGLWSYWGHQRSERELQRYMSEYIQARKIQGQIDHRRRAEFEYAPVSIDSGYTESAENPFAAVVISTMDNPFRSEDQ
jgi:anti-sigma factor RsiW